MSDDENTNESTQGGPMVSCIIDHRLVATGAWMAGADRVNCAMCGLPVGMICEPEPDAKMTPAVAIEIRAAELSMHGADGNFDKFTEAEWYGWQACSVWFCSQESELAGWLACEIASTP